MSPAEKTSMIARQHPKLSIVRQCELLKLSRSAFYYTPVGLDEETLAVMKAIDKTFTKYPFFGSRQIRAYLRREDIVVGRHRIRRLMRLMGLEAVYRRPQKPTAGSIKHGCKAAFLPLLAACPLVFGQTVQCPVPTQGLSYDGSGPKRQHAFAQRRATKYRVHIWRQSI